MLRTVAHDILETLHLSLPSRRNYQIKLRQLDVLVGQSNLKSYARSTLMCTRLFTPHMGIPLTEERPLRYGFVQLYRT